MIHHPVVRGNGAGPDAVLVCEAAGEHERVKLFQARGLRPMHQLGVAAAIAKQAHGLVLGVGSGKDGNGDAAAHGKSSAKGRDQIS